MDNYAKSLFIILTTLLLIGLASLGLVHYTDNSWWDILTEAVPGFGAIASVVLVVYYSRLVAQSKEQTEAMKASYAPNLTEIDSAAIAVSEAQKDGLDVKMVNRGEGVSKNIEIKSELITDSEVYKFRATTNTSLPTGHRLVSQDHSTALPFKLVFYNSDGDSTNIIQLLNQIDREEYPRLNMEIRYCDIRGEDYGPEIVFEEKYLQTDVDTMEEALQNSRARITVIPGKIHKRFWFYITHFIEDISSKTEHQEYKTELKCSVRDMS